MNNHQRIAIDLMKHADFSVPSPLHPVAVEMSKSNTSDESSQYYQKSSRKTQMLWFHAEWCGHCRNMKDEWVKAAEKGKRFAEWHAINCDEPNDLAKEMNVRSFPTIKRIRKGQVTDFTDSRTEQALIQFARSRS